MVVHEGYQSGNVQLREILQTVFEGDKCLVFYTRG